MSKIDFIIVGTQKGGTTSLDKYLRQHPRISMPKKYKELHFFDKYKFLHEPIQFSFVYHMFFESYSEGKRRGEATPIYLYYPQAIARIWRYNPKIKLIAMLRDPAKRAYSHWWKECKLGRQTISFSEAIRSERQRCRASLPHRDRNHSYLDRGFYSEQIRHLFRFFDRNQLLFIESEEFFKTPQTSLDKICDFLEVEQFDFDTREKHNVKEDKPKLLQEDAAYMNRIFENDVAEVRSLLGWKLESWLKV